jgi:hypothetical protein
MTWQGYSPSSVSARGDKPAPRRASAGPGRAGNNSTSHPPEASTSLWRGRGIRIFGGTAAAALVAVGGIALIRTGDAAAAPNPNCSLIVPANPLTAAGLATPYQLVATNPRQGPCHEANPNQSAYVQGAIIDANGNITLYNPLVIDKGTKPAAAPAAATVPSGSTVGLWFGFNGTNLTLQNANNTNSLQQGMCVNGLNNNGNVSVFGQFADCNGPGFFSAAKSAMAAGKLAVPALATARDGKPCPTLRDFSVVDMDQSDNVTTHYLANAKGQTSQPNAAARAALQNQQLTDLFNGSDNRLLDAFIDPTLGCQPWTRPEQSNDGQAAPSLALNELQAAAKQAAPVANVPLTDPMTLNAAGAQSTTKTNAYRAGVDQAPVGAADDGNGTTYCNNLFNTPGGIQRVFKDQAIFANGPSPDAGAATNLFTFLAMRANDAFAGLGCTGNSPIQLTMNGNGVVIAAKFVPGGAPQAGNAAAAAASPTPTKATSKKGTFRGKHGYWHM